MRTLKSAREARNGGEGGKETAGEGLGGNKADINCKVHLPCAKVKTIECYKLHTEIPRELK